MVTVTDSITPPGVPDHYRLTADGHWREDADASDHALLADLRRIAATVDPEPRLHIVPDGQGGRRIVEDHDVDVPFGAGEPVARAARKPKRGRAVNARPATPEER